ncbi:MAG: acyl-CoA dehydrogenase [Holophagales bacterium]|nr:acyl-CoA dehydrogenase [Holophagales bacterium]MYG31906.1 acyl-CoA dehydrogenase [Holophagales bacterium]MYI79748.1 acyl-CoA dehydrogenase [Holophagales bacterium]
MKAPTVHLRFSPAVVPEAADNLRSEVRELLEETRAEGVWLPDGLSWWGRNPALSRALGDAGFIGMTWPREYGGSERSYLERYVVTEELLAACAPTAFHWFADRQIGPSILRYGTEEQKQRFLPPIARGELSFAVGMSEPDSGSDLASIRTRAERTNGGWRLNGSKIWTSYAHDAEYCVALVRTEPKSDKRHAGMSQVIIDLKNSDGITVRPIIDLPGRHDFNEVFFEDAFVPDDCLLGNPGDGWAQVTSELAYERSGPERFLTNFHLLGALVDVLDGNTSPAARREVGLLVSRLWALRAASVSVAAALEAGETPNVESALVKDLGTNFQQEVPEIVRRVVADEGVSDQGVLDILRQVILAAPSYTIQGGATEILRGIVARGLRLR